MALAPSLQASPCRCGSEYSNFAFREGNYFAARAKLEYSSVDLHPVERAVHRLLPAVVAAGPLLLGRLRQPALGLVPVGAELFGGGPEAGGQAGRVRGAERGGLGDDRAADRHAEG